MAVIQHPLALSLVLTIGGPMVDGKPTSKKYTYPKLRSNVTPEAVYSVAESFAKLHNGPMVQVNFIANNELYEG